MHRGGEGTRPMTTACAGFRRGKKNYYELQQAGNKSDVKNKNVKKAQAQIWLVPFLLSHDIRDFRFMVEIKWHWLWYTYIVFHHRQWIKHINHKHFPPNPVFSGRVREYDTDYDTEIYVVPHTVKHTNTKLSYSLSCKSSISRSCGILWHRL